MIYFIQAGENGPIKIGQSDNPEERLKQLQTANYQELKLLWIYDDTDDEVYTESNLHEELSHLKIRGEWYSSERGEIKKFIHDYLRNSYMVNTHNGENFSIEESFYNHQIIYHNSNTIGISNNEINYLCYDISKQIIIKEWNKIYATAY